MEFFSGRFTPSAMAPLDTAAEHERAELFAMWTAARAEANLAYEEWTAEPGPACFWAYRAAEERADAAEDALAEACGRHTARPPFRLAA